MLKLYNPHTDLTLTDPDPNLPTLTLTAFRYGGRTSHRQSENGVANIQYLPPKVVSTRTDFLVRGSDGRLF